MSNSHGERGNPDQSVEVRLARLETAVEFMRIDITDIKQTLRKMQDDIMSIRTTDFRLLFGAIIGVSLGLTAVMAKGFGWI
mgnify:CR=1 FL=1